MPFLTGGPQLGAWLVVLAGNCKGRGKGSIINIMGCPMFERKEETQRPLEYPFESLYRPWSWVLSIFNNVAIFAILFLLVYALFRRARSRGKRKTLYRKVAVNEQEEGSKVRALVTGGSGCLGRELVRSLLEDGGYTVYSMDLTIPDEAKRHPAVAAYLQLDMQDTEELEIALRDVTPEVVFHVAGLLPKLGIKNSAMYAVNETGTKNIVNACKEVGVKRLLYTSTTDVVMSRDPSQILDRADETTPYPSDPLDAYTGSKMNAEKAVVYANDESLFTCCLRPSPVAAVDAVMCHPLLTDEAGYIDGGMNEMTIVPIGACARGHILAEKKLREGASSIAAGRVYNLCGDDVFKTRDFMSYSLEKDSNTTIWGHPKPRSYPKWLVTIAAAVNQSLHYLTGLSFSPYLTLANIGFITRSYTFSNSRAHKELGWETLPSWKKIVEELVEEHRNKKDI